MGLIKMLQDEIKLAKEFAKISHKCKCGHTVPIPNKVNFVYCGWCHRRVYKNKEIEFKYKLMSACGKGKNEQIL